MKIVSSPNFYYDDEGMKVSVVRVVGDDHVQCILHTIPKCAKENLKVRWWWGANDVMLQDDKYLQK